VVSLDPTSIDDRTCEQDVLLDQARTGSTEAFGELCRFFETRLLRHAFSLCRNLDLAENLAQDTLVEGWRCLHRYNGRCQFFTWLCAILLNRYRNSLREKHPVALSTLAEVEGDEAAQRAGRLRDTNALPDEAIQLQEQSVLVQKCIRSLPKKQQQVIFLRFFVDTSLDSIAAALGCSVGTVKSRLFHALERLRAMKELQRQFDNFKPTTRHL
jgi:RNA polymerase sigma-70 factor (ECF subfamily)